MESAGADGGLGCVLLVMIAVGILAWLRSEETDRLNDRMGRHGRKIRD